MTPRGFSQIGAVSLRKTVSLSALVLLAALLGSAGCSEATSPLPTAAVADHLSPPPTVLPMPSPTVPSSAAATPTPGFIPLTTRQALPQTAAGPTASPTVAPPSFDGANAAAEVAKLASEIGSRPSGSLALSQAADHLPAVLGALGYDAHLQPYSFINFQDHLSRLVLKQPEELEISASAFVYSGSGTVEAQLVYCGLGRAADFPTLGVRGKVALIDRGGGIKFQDKVAAATARGAAAVIVSNDRNGELRGALVEQAAVPVVGILQSDGLRLRDYLKRGTAAVSLKVDAATFQRQGSNVVASSKETTGGRVVIIGAHYDSVSTGPGANDNASGVATMLELARAVRGQRFPFRLVFIAFGDEEVGLIGSKRYVESLTPQQRSQILAMINFDMVGVGETLEFGGDSDLVRRSLQIARQMGYTASEWSVASGTTSDHSSFLDAGIPALFFHRAEDPNYHTKLDTTDKVAPEKLEAAGKVAIRLLNELGRSN